jgi:hypothetical protein
MQIKPVRMVKSVTRTGSRAIEDADAPVRPKVRHAAPPPLPKGLTFADGRLTRDGRPFGQVIRAAATQDPALLSALARELEAYKKARLARRNRLAREYPRVVAQEDDELGVLFAVCDAHIEQIGRHIQKRYDQTRDGFAVEFDENGQLILNGMNVHAFVASCKTAPSEKSRVFLKGVRTRLGRVLENRSGSSLYEKLRDVITGLIAEIDSFLNAAKDLP